MDYIQRQYQGYLNTALLWKEHDLLGLYQLELPKQNILEFNQSLSDNLRLGKRVERFVSAELKQNTAIEILLENTQIKQEKITIGEIDCILKQNGVPIHLEIIYKFYLYDPNVGTTEIEHWIGPNRKDSLLKKLYKLKDKQLPLIYNEHARSVLKAIHVNPSEILQRVHFKAQLFMPYQGDLDHFNLLNKDCHKGFYIHYSKIKQFSHCRFYKPNKTDWLVEVQTDVDWVTFLEFEKSISQQMNEETAPLCWIKHLNGQTDKFFVVWWN